MIMIMWFQYKLCYLMITDYVDYEIYEMHSLENLYVKYH